MKYYFEVIKDRKKIQKLSCVCDPEKVDEVFAEKVNEASDCGADNIIIYQCEEVFEPETFIVVKNYNCKEFFEG